MYRKILVANDGSKGAVAAFSAGLDLAKRLRAELHMISVEELPRFATTIDETVEEKQEADHIYSRVTAQARRQAKAQQVRFETHVVAGHPVPAILDFMAREGCDLLVVGYMGHSALYNRLIGSTTDRLVELAPCAVLVVK
ncbi:MAG: universal stress protein [Pseudomonadota bacterium]